MFPDKFVDPGVGGNFTVKVDIISLLNFILDKVLAKSQPKLWKI